MQIFIGGAGGPRAEPYEGVVEAWRDAEGTTVIVTEEELPGFSLYISDARTIKQLTIEDKRPGIRQLEVELASMLESGRFVKHVMDAHKAGQLKATVHESGDVTFTGPIAREIVRPVSNVIEVQGMVIQNMGPQSRVMRAEGSFTVTKEGRFRSIAIKLVRNDSMAEMMRNGIGGNIRIVGGGGVVLGGGNDQKNKEKHEIEGGSTTYTLTFGDNKPSDRAAGFKRKVLRMLSR